MMPEKNSTLKTKIPVCAVYILFILCAAIGYGQKEPQYTQYMYNIGSFNPAYVNTVGNIELTALYRAQWISIPGAPKTFRIGLNAPLSNEKMGLGLNIVNDQVGPVTQTYADIAYAYQINISPSTQLSFGLELGGSFLNVDFEKGTFENPGEALNQARISEFYPTIGAGTFIYGEDWYVGASVPNFLTEGIYNEEVLSIIEDRFQFNIVGGYVFNLNDNLKFKPAFLANKLGGAPLNLNLSANFLMVDRFTAGVSYRINNAFSGLAGFQVNEFIYLGYAYDYNTSPLGEFNQGSHEIILKYLLGNGSNSKGSNNKTNNSKGKVKQIDTPRFF